MKKIKVYLIGQKFEIELEDEFYDYIQNDIMKLNNSSNQIKDILDLILSLEYKMYENEQKMTNLLKKFEK
jgi:hypothetical protein